MKIVSVLLIAPVWGQSPRRTVDAGRVAQAERRVDRPARVRARGALLAGESQASAPGQAPGVIQTNLLDASNLVWFVTVDKLPAGTALSPFVVFPDGTEMPLTGFTLTEDVAAGSSFDMPNIRKFGQFWPEGLMTYGMTVTLRGRDTQAAADFPVFSARDYDSVAKMVPRITTNSEFVTNGDAMVRVQGAFTSDMVYVVLDDLVAPRGAVRVSPTEITVNLSKVPGLDLGVMREFLLTVGQGGWSDTAVFRHTPGRPGTYNPAPR